MLNTRTKSDIHMIVDVIRPVMVEIYKRSPEIASFGFEFDADNRLSCPKDKEFEALVQEMLSFTSLADFRKEHGKEVEMMGYSLNNYGRLVPLESNSERLAGLMINPLASVDQLIYLEDRVLLNCLKALKDSPDEDLQFSRKLINSENGMDRLLVAAPWRIALSELYMVFGDTRFAVDALRKAEPIQVLGLVMMVNLFAMHQKIKLPGDWYNTALKHAYLYAEKHYA